MKNPIKAIRNEIRFRWVVFGIWRTKRRVDKLRRKQQKRHRELTVKISLDARRMTEALNSCGVSAKKMAEAMRIALSSVSRETIKHQPAFDERFRKAGRRGAAAGRRLRDRSRIDPGPPAGGLRPTDDPPPDEHGPRIVFDHTAADDFDPSDRTV